jgi:hypothetical protein
MFSAHEGTHGKIIHSIINPIFIKYSRLMIKEIMRLLNKTCIYLEILP